MDTLVALGTEDTALLHERQPVAAVVPRWKHGTSITKPAH